MKSSITTFESYVSSHSSVKSKASESR